MNPLPTTDESLYTGFTSIGRFGWECDLCASPVRPCNMRRHREACEREFAIWEGVHAESEREWGNAA